MSDVHRFEDQHWLEATKTDRPLFRARARVIAEQGSKLEILAEDGSVVSSVMMYEEAGPGLHTLYAEGMSAQKMTHRFSGTRHGDVTFECKEVL